PVRRRPGQPRSVGATTGDLGSDVRADWRRRVSEAVVGQAEGKDRPQRGSIHARPRIRFELQLAHKLGDAGAEAARQDSYVRGRHGSFLSEPGRLQAGRNFEGAAESALRMRLSVWAPDEGPRMATGHARENDSVDGGACHEKCAGRGKRCRLELLGALE